MTKDTKRPGALPDLTPAQRKAQEGALLVADEQGRTAIRVSETENEIGYIPMAAEGCHVLYTSPANFRLRYKFTHKDPKPLPSMRSSTITSAARCYVLHATYAGATEEALTALEQLVPITTAEREKIMTASKTKKTAPEAAGAAPKAAKKTTKAPKEKKERGPSVGATFRELIMAGKLTDDQIFAEVQKRHPQVGDDKRKYVAWYRNDLVKKGENPPKKKEAPKADKK